MTGFLSLVAAHPIVGVSAALAAALVVYLAHINRLMRGTPDEILRLMTQRWTSELVKETYARLEKQPFTVQSYKAQLPPKLERRYIVTGGCGLVGGTLVLQLLARGQSPESIRIVDFQDMERRDMLDGPAREIDVVKTDISSADSADAAFSKPWPASVARLPLTVFHSAAIMVPSDRSKLVYANVERVNVGGTKNVLDAARRAGADVFISTSSGSIAIRPVGFWVAPWHWSAWPENYVQRLDEADFFKPIRQHEEYYCNYAVSKATAERIVCAANCPSLRTGAIRPANGIYGYPTDNIVGMPLNEGELPSWSFNIVNPFVHTANCAVAHLDFEAVLADPDSASAPQSGRPFTVTDPNPPIMFSDLFHMMETLSATPFRTVSLIPICIFLISYAIEALYLLPARSPLLKKIVPPITGDVKLLQPPIFSIVTHVYSNNEACSSPVRDGGLGYRGVVTTLDGMVQQVLDWNREHEGLEKADWVTYRRSISIAEDISKAGEN